MLLTKIYLDMVAHLARAIEYTGCIFAEGVRPPPVSVLDISEFDHQSHDYIHVQTKILRRGMTLLILSIKGLNSITAVLLQGYLWH